MSRERIITGIDIGSSKICTVIAQLSGEDKVSVIGVSSTPSRGIKKGVVVGIDEAVEAIAKSLEAAERMAGYAVNGAFVLVDGSHIASMNSKGVVAVAHQDTEITPVDVSRATEAAQAVSIPSSQEMIHVIPRGYIVDSQEGIKDPLGMSGIRLEVETNIIYGAAAVMRNLVRCVQQVGVDVEDLVYSGIAGAESVLNDTEKELGTILADIGGGTASVTIFLAGSPIYSSVLPIGGQNITNDLAIGLRTSIDNAEKIKIRLSQETAQHNLMTGINSDTDFTPVLAKLVSQETVRNDLLDVSDLGLETGKVEKRILNEIIRARLNEIFSLIALEIKKSGLAGRLPGGIVITGGAAETVGVTEAARSILKMPVRIGYPNGATGLIEEVRGPAYAASIGLVLYGVKNVTSGGGLSGLSKGKFGSVLKKIIGFVKSLLP
ncbi:MAG: cell division protein FtsA [Patescibacteria group bacterium]